MAIAIGIATILYLDNGIATAKWLNASEKRLLADEIAAQPQELTESYSLRAVFRDPRTWWMSLIYFAFVLGIGASGRLRWYFCQPSMGPA